jgi:acyl-CoA reductase-like NAD-dependent aldehyde dehydrogenase
MKSIDQLSLAELSELVREAKAAVGKKTPDQWTRTTVARVRRVLQQAKLAA